MLVSEADDRMMPFSLKSITNGHRAQQRNQGVAATTEWPFSSSASSVASTRPCWTSTGYNRQAGICSPEKTLLLCDLCLCDMYILPWSGSLWRSSHFWRQPWNKKNQDQNVKALPSLIGILKEPDKAHVLWWFRVGSWSRRDLRVQLLYLEQSWLLFRKKPWTELESHIYFIIQILKQEYSPPSFLPDVPLESALFFHRTASYRCCKEDRGWIFSWSALWLPDMSLAPRLVKHQRQFTKEQIVL